MEVKTGYKQTEIGVIPSDWKVIKLADVSELMTNGFVGTATNHYTEDRDGVLYIQGFNVEENGFNFTGIKKVSQAFHRAHQKSCLRTGDLLTIQTGDVGLTTVVPEELAGSNCHALIITRLNSKKANSNFASSYLNSKAGRSRLRLLETGTTMKHLNVGDVLQYQMPLPPLPEQQAIANALSDADALIESLEQLIEKKRQIKQGVMQELLTGKRRLPGFSGEWDTFELGELIEHCSSGSTPYRGRPDFYKGKVRWITSGELNYCVINDTNEHISQEAVVKTNLKVHPPGTFLMAITGLEAAGTRGACGIVGKPSTTNQSCMAVYPNKRLDTGFLYHFYVFKGGELALKYCQGTKQQSYTARLVKLLPVLMPPSIEEQKVISSILSNADAEIFQLNLKLEKVKNLKQAMMQELLTGKVRLV